MIDAKFLVLPAAMQKINMVDNEASKKVPVAKKTPVAPGKAPQKATTRPVRAEAQKPAVGAPQTSASAGKAPVKATSPRTPAIGGPVMKASTHAKIPAASKATGQPRKPIVGPVDAAEDSIPVRKKPVPPAVLPSRKKPAQPSVQKKSDAAMSAATGMLRYHGHRPITLSCRVDRRCGV